MAPVREHGKKKPGGYPHSTAKGINHRPGMKNKRRWVPPEARRKFEGSSSEGQGFAFRRKQKIQQQYRKLLRKEKVNPGVQYTDNYPEHLKHLYEAEEEMLKKQKKKNEGNDKGIQMLTEQKEPTIPEPSTTNMAITTNRTKFMKKTSNVKAKEEYERIQAKRAKKKEEALKRQKEREEAQKLYRQRKMESYKILSKKTKKGQPNLNLQMEYLLQKIQQNS